MDAWDEDDFQRKLDEDPSDWVTRVVFADWLDERSDRRAAGYRALGMMRVYPYSALYEWNDGNTIYSYHNGRGWASGRVAPMCHALPQMWLDRTQDEEFRVLGMEAREPSHNTVWSTCVMHTRRLLEDCAAHAFLQLPEAMRRVCLSGEECPK